MKREFALLFSYKGKLSPREYLLSLFLLALMVFGSLFMAFLLFEKSDILPAVLLITYLFSFWMIQLKRCRDAGISGYWILLSFVPYIKWVWWVALGILPSTESHTYKQYKHRNKKEEDEDGGSDPIESAFAILEVPIDATSQEIRTAYKKKIAQYHPDKIHHMGKKLQQLAQNETQKINEAYATLKEYGFV